MIQAHELRVGNLVAVPPLNRIGKVIAFTTKSIKVKLSDSTLTSVTHKGITGLDVEGIELTDEWLSKFGFEIYNTVGGYLCWKKDNFKLLDRKLPATNMRFITSVHQLQNLYFSMYGVGLLDS